MKKGILPLSSQFSRWARLVSNQRPLACAERSPGGDGLAQRDVQPPPSGGDSRPSAASICSWLSWSKTGSFSSQ
jgi:hypothetical protein